jgi:hypothetical protein
MEQLTDHDLEIIFKLEHRNVIEIDRLRLYREYKLSESFAEKYPNLIDWNLLSLYQDLSSEFITRNINRITSSVLNNPCYKKFPDSLKLLLETKFKGQTEKPLQKPLLVWFVESYPGFAVTLFWIVVDGLAVILKFILSPK